MSLLVFCLRWQAFGSSLLCCFFVPLLVSSCILLVSFLEPLGSFLVNILPFINKKKMKGRSFTSEDKVRLY